MGRPVLILAASGGVLWAALATVWAASGAGAALLIIALLLTLAITGSALFDPRARRAGAGWALGGYAALNSAFLIAVSGAAARSPVPVADNEGLAMAVHVWAFGQACALSVMSVLAQWPARAARPVRKS